MALLRIAVQSKGRLYDETMALLNEADIKLSAVKRTLLIASRNFPVELLMMRDDDIPECVASGISHLGIVGLNEVMERGKDVKIIRKLGFSKCRLSIAVPKKSGINDIRQLQGKKIATSYPNILNKWLEENNIAADVHVITGSVEIAPGIGIADAIFDIVSSGSTLVSNNLEELYTVMQSEAVLIAGNDVLDSESQEVLDELLFRFEAVKCADDKKYILMNVPRSKLDAVLDVLPGIKSPTVLPLADSEWCSVHTVVSEKHFWNIIGKLKDAGAEGILVLDIEKMVL